MIEVTVHEVYEITREREGASSMETVIVLHARGEDRYLPIWVSPTQAGEIVQCLRKETTQRPTTHKLMAQLVERLKGRVDGVRITMLEGSIYYASLRLATGEGTIEVDCRPSDALPLAAQAGAPIFVGADLLERAGCDGPTAFHTDSKSAIRPLQLKSVY